MCLKVESSRELGRVRRRARVFALTEKGEMRFRRRNIVRRLSSRDAWHTLLCFREFA